MLLKLLLAVRNVFRHKGRSIITLSAISFGAVSIIVASGFVEDTIKRTEENYIRSILGHVQIAKKGYFERGVAYPFQYLISGSDRVLKDLRTVEHVSYAAPRLEFGGIISTGENSIAFMGQAGDPQIESEMNTAVTIVRGKDLAAGDEFQVLVGTGLSNAILSPVGGTVIVLTNTKTGLVDAMDVTVKGVFQSMVKAFDDRAARMPLSTARRVLHLKDEIHKIVIVADGSDNTDAVKAAIEARLKALGRDDLEVRAWYELGDSDFIHKVKNFLERMLTTLKFIITFIVILSIFNTMNMSVMERTGEIGTLMALGDTRRDVLKLFVMEGLVYGLIGGVAGLAGGYAAARLISAIGIPMPVPPGSTAAWTAKIMLLPETFVFAFGVALGTSLLSSIYPALKASKLEIAEALRHNI